MIANWTDWKHYPRALRGETIEASIGPGLLEVRVAQTGSLFAFEATDNLAQALAKISAPPKSFISWFGRRDAAMLPELEYRTFPTATRANAKIAFARMIDRRETYMRGAA
ncbi:hypothetical protein RPMA_00180 [Tardiphaga alba]|uniref:KTSC domain-containing protein n=1 Tax=Tardiphaga alba TaxID=340268 RepID=A0ABX8A1Z3_9BRAD|nr:hypothetical protein [Tardiphaga alba]QUS37463.1 hypothetical protein RPMA_00180 [Tardiphaga alba]